MRYLDLNTWNRKQHFEFFSQFEEPYFGVCVDIDCTETYQRAKSEGHSFFLSYLHKSIHAVNQVEALRYRIDQEGRVVVHDRIDASATIDRLDGTFGFSYIEYHLDFEHFNANAQIEIERVRAAGQLFPLINGDQVVHYSSLPWIKFTALSHARPFAYRDSVPKISFGQLHQRDGRYWMPMSVHAHHGLADALHVGQYIQIFQDVLVS